jgi:hypothetical protein
VWSLQIIEVVRCFVQSIIIIVFDYSVRIHMIIVLTMHSRKNTPLSRHFLRLTSNAPIFYSSSDKGSLTTPDDQLDISLVVDLHADQYSCLIKIPRWKGQNNTGEYSFLALHIHELIMRRSMPCRPLERHLYVMAYQLRLIH